MEAGRFGGRDVDLIDAMVMGADDRCSDEESARIERCACPGCGSCSGMFTANSMNCLTEALGLSLPGNGTIVATHVARRRLFEEAAALIVRNAERYYFEATTRCSRARSPRRRPSRTPCRSTSPWAARPTRCCTCWPWPTRRAWTFTMQDIDRLSRRVPVLCKVAPNSHYHIRMSTAPAASSRSWENSPRGTRRHLGRGSTAARSGEAIAACDLRSATVGDDALAAGERPRRHRATGSWAYRTPLRNARHRPRGGLHPRPEHAYFRDGGLAVLTGNIARCGCVVKTAGVDEKLLLFRGPARVYESQEQAMEGILGDEVRPGEVVVIRYEGPKGGPGMQEMLYPTSYLKSKRLDKVCALVTDGRFSGGTSGLSIGHVSPEAAAGGEIAIVHTGDPIEIDIPNRSIRLLVDEREIAARKAAVKRYAPAARERRVPTSLRAYALLVSSADKGAVRLIDTPDNA